MLSCSQCNKKFKYKSELARHEQSHSRQFECSICDKKFSFQSALHRHEKQHNRTGNVSCDKCGHSFRDYGLLKRHMKYAHDATQVCEKCLSKFHSLTALQTHLRTHRSESERRFRCQFSGCGKSFNFSHHLKNHELTHTNTKKYFCKFCGKGFIQGHHLKVHTKTHEAKWFYCDNDGCNKKFLTSIAKEKHSATHGTITVKEPTILPFTLSAISDGQNDVKGNRLTIGDEFERKVQINSLVIDKTEPRVWQQEVIEDALNETSMTLNNNTCKSVLGKCIVSESTDNDENCFCSQINSNSSRNMLNATVDQKESNGHVTLTTVVKDMECDIFDPISNLKSDICGECDCNRSCMKINLSKSIMISPETPDVPAVTFQTDGTILLKETFDTSIKIQNRLQEDFNDSHIPFNSCKAVLGKCIVSGNGTMGEECLCAKMMNDRSVNSEEIDELTLVPAQFN